jgi:hypothetical protein
VTDRAFDRLKARLAMDADAGGDRGVAGPAGAAVPPGDDGATPVGSDAVTGRQA